MAVVVMAIWFFGGPNFKWSKSKVGHQEKDPVTEIEVTVYEDRFVPGIDFLGAGLVVSGLMSTASWFFKPRAAAKP